LESEWKTTAVRVLESEFGIEISACIGIGIGGNIDTIPAKLYI